MNAVVIGSGISGLVAALRLVKLGHSVTIFEPGEIGGLIQTSHVNGFQIELGPNVFVEKPEFDALICEIGLQNAKVFPRCADYKQFVWFGGKAVRVPKSPGTFIKSPLFSHFDKAKILFRLFRKGVLKPESDDESVETFFSRLIGKRGVSRLLDPALQGIFGGDVAKLSARSVFPEVWREAFAEKSLMQIMKGKAKRRIFVLRKGASSVVGALQRSIIDTAQIIHERVISVSRVGAQFLVTSETSNIMADFVCVTTSGDATASFIGEISPELRRSLHSTNFARLTVVHLGVQKGAVPTDAFGVLFPRGETSGLLGVMYNSELFPHVSPPGKDILTLCFGGDLFNQAHSDEEIYKIAQSEVERVLNVRSVEPLNVHRWDKAIFQQEIGHQNLVDLMRDVEEKNPGIVFLGTDCGGIGVPDRVAMAESAVKRITSLDSTPFVQKQLFSNSR